MTATRQIFVQTNLWGSLEKTWAFLPGLVTETLGYCHSCTCCHHQTVDRNRKQKINMVCRRRCKKNWGPRRRCEEEKLFTGGLKCETNDFVTLVKPRGGMAAWVITVRQRAGNQAT